MAEAEDKKDEEKLEFTPEGETFGYISLDQARVLALQHARDNRDFYGRRYANQDLVWEVVASTETEDYYEIRLSYRPARGFQGEPGLEQFTVDKTGPIQFRQNLSDPKALGRSRWATAVIGVVALVAIAGAIVGGLFAAGVISGGGEATSPTISIEVSPGSPTQLVTPDGAVTIDLDSGTVDTSARLSYRSLTDAEIPVLPPSFEATGKAFDLSIDGSLKKSVTITVKLSAADATLANNDPSNVIIQHFRDGGWTALPTDADFSASTAVAQVDRLSPFALTVLRVPPVPGPVIAEPITPVPGPTDPPTPTVPAPTDTPPPVEVEHPEPTTPPPPPQVRPSVASVIVSPSTEGLIIGDTLQLEATALDGDGDALPEAIIGWASSDTSVAIVSGDGTVTAVSPGPVTINAISEGRTGSAAISVSNKPVASVKLSEGSRPLAWDQNLVLVATVEDAQGDRLDDRVVTWTSSDPSVAEVDSEGRVTIVGEGKTLITAESEGKTRKITLTIPPRPVDPGFELFIYDIAVPAGATSAPVPGGYVVLSPPPQADGTYPSGTIVTMTVVPNSSSATYTWRNTNSQSGATATVEISGQRFIYVDITTGSIPVTPVPPVAPAPVATVSVTPSSGSVGIGDGFQLTATAFDSSGNVLTGRSFGWASSNSSVATVSANGIVTGLALGSATISATSEGRIGSSAITVSEVQVASVSLTAGSTSVDEGATINLQAAAKDAQGNTLVGRVITWTTSNSSVATVAANGTVTGVGDGSVVITAESAGKSSQITLTVSAVPVATVEVSPSSASLSVGDSQQLMATTKNAGGVTLTGRTITWSSSNSSVASVNSSGNVTAAAAGSTTITATSEGKSGSSSITVTTPTPTPTPTGGKIVFAREPEGVNGWGHLRYGPRWNEYYQVDERTHS